MFGFKSLIGIILVLFISYFIHFIGFFYKIPEYQEQYHNCEYLDESLFGTEDAVFFNKDILIGVYVNIYTIFSSPAPLEQIEQGGFFATYGISTGNLKSKKIQVKNFPKNVFHHPHGIYLRNSDHLHAINHAFYKGGERVETYKIVQEPSGDIVLEYLHSTQLDNSFNGITNDVLFLNQNRFLITVWQVFTYPLNGCKDKPFWYDLGTLVTQIFQFKTTNVWDCQYAIDGIAQCSKVPDSNGISMNSIAYDGKNTLAFTDNLSKLIKMYRVEENGSLQLIQNVSVKQMPDNIQYDQKRKQFITAGLYNPSEFLKLEAAHQQIKNNTSKKSVIEFSAIVEGVQYNNSTQKFESNLIFSSNNALATVSGALIDESQNYMFLTNFGDKSLVVCKKNQ